MIIYSKSAGTNDYAIGKLETPIKMLIEHESDLSVHKNGTAKQLFNIQKSNRFGETIITEDEFDIFQATEEGAAAPTDSVKELYKKFVEHIQFSKEFVITAEMMEDANYGIGADAKHRVENFVRAYYKTINRLCETALSNGTKRETTFAGTNIDLSCSDGHALFSNCHVYGPDENIQCNLFWGNIFKKNNADGKRVYDIEQFEESLAKLSNRLRNMKDDSGTPLGYTPDTIILPGNRPLAESMVRKVCGCYFDKNTEGELNINYGKWNIIVLPTWVADNDCLMIMSSEANKSLCGNMLFNRIPLTINNWVDYHTGNYIWNGRCRFGIGFGNYKHIILAMDTEEYNGDGDML